MNFHYTRVLQEQLSTLEEFFQSVYQGSVSYGSSHLFRWKIFENINGTGFVNSALVDEKIVSTTSLTPKQLLLNQVLHPAAEIGDSYTHKNFQRQGLFAALVNRTREEAEAQKIHYVYGTPNENSLPGYLKKCNFVVVLSPKVYSYSMPLTVAPFISAKLKLKFLTLIIDYCFKTILKFFLSIRQTGIKLIPILDFDKRFDLLWDSVKQNYDYVFLRNSKALNWRFCNTPYEYQKLAIQNGDQLIGYIVLREDQKNGSVFIADYFCLKEQCHGFESVLKQLASTYIEKRYQKITSWVSMNDHLLSSYTKTMYIRRNAVPIVAYGNELSKLAMQSNSCHFSLSDSDNI